MTELEAKAAEAWAHVVRPETVLTRALGGGPMPVAIALDMVQDVTGDRDEALTAVLTAASDWLRGRIPSEPCPFASPQMADANAACGEIPGEFFGHAELWVADVAENARRVIERFVVLAVRHVTEADRLDYFRAVEWKRWAADATRTIALCRQLCAAAHPEPDPVPSDIDGRAARSKPSP